MDYRLLLWPKDSLPNYQNSGETEQTEITDCIRISLVQEPDIAVYLPPKGVQQGRLSLFVPAVAMEYFLTIGKVCK